MLPGLFIAILGAMNTEIASFSSRLITSDLIFCNIVSVLHLRQLGLPKQIGSCRYLLIIYQSS